MQDADEGSGDEPPARGKAGKKKAGARSESKGDASTARGAGLKALAQKLDLIEPSDPADLDESDPIIDFEDPTPVKAPKKAAKAAKKK